jgi:hypothetical protein
MRGCCGQNDIRYAEESSSRRGEVDLRVFVALPTLSDRLPRLVEAEFCARQQCEVSCGAAVDADVLVDIVYETRWWWYIPFLFDSEGIESRVELVVKEKGRITCWPAGRCRRRYDYDFLIDDHLDHF